ncbi:MAG: S24 family peptidase [Caldisericia bacterium]
MINLSAINAFLQHKKVDNKVIFKKFKKENRKIFLEPANAHYEKIELTTDMDVKLFKVVMALGKKGTQ